MSRLFLHGFLWLILLTVLAPSASAQLAVYRLQFDSTGETINYRPYESGYYVAPMNGGEGSLILTLTTGGVKRYFTYEDFGEFFVAVDGGSRKSVLSATAANTVSTTTFYAIGDASERFSVETRSAEQRVYLARTLRGYSVSADSERDLPFSSGSSVDIGVAGASLLTAKFDEGRSEQANREERSVEEEISDLEAFLEGNGFIDGFDDPTVETGTDNGGNGGGGGNAAAR